MLSPEQILETYRRFAQSNPAYETSIRLDHLPFERYDIYRRWKPDIVKVLFIAESPPWNESVYFYNEDSEGGLSSSIFRLLKIQGTTKNDRLLLFRSKGFFLVDTVKCVFRKDLRTSIPQSLIKYSAQEILQHEIESLAPDAILVLGATAFSALRHIPKFTNALSKFNSVVEGCGRAVHAKGIDIIISAFPNDRNRKYRRRIELAFKQAQTYASAVFLKT